MQVIKNSVNGDQKVRNSDWYTPPYREWSPKMVF